MKYRLIDSNFSLTEFVRNKRKVCSVIKASSTVREWHEENCVYWNVAVALTCVWTSNILFHAKRGPLKTSVSQKTVRSDDSLHVNLIVALNLSAKSTKLLISCLLKVHSEKM